MATYRYVTSESANARYAHIGHPTLCRRVFAGPRRVTENMPYDRAVCPACVAKATGYGWITTDEAQALLGRDRSQTRDLPPRRGAAMLVPLMIEGRSDQEIAMRLRISTRTVNRLVTDAMRALGARTRFQWGYLVGVAAR
ncbi:MAG: Bacterial regulatory protein luxR family [Frankiaceae bacterium]|jgi:DNA-binding NarL/FixJ family response regulator|nr:Bacterial regulatory protein luxR family [Frankiaceae bacterium]